MGKDFQKLKTKSWLKKINNEVKERFHNSNSFKTKSNKKLKKKNVNKKDKEVKYLLNEDLPVKIKKHINKSNIKNITKVDALGEDIIPNEKLKSSLVKKAILKNKNKILDGKYFQKQITDLIVNQNNEIDKKHISSTSEISVKEKKVCFEDQQIQLKKSLTRDIASIDSKVLGIIRSTDKKIYCKDNKIYMKRLKPYFHDAINISLDCHQTDNKKLYLQKQQILMKKSKPCISAIHALKVSKQNQLKKKKNLIHIKENNKEGVFVKLHIKKKHYCKINEVQEININSSGKRTMSVPELVPLNMVSSVKKWSVSSGGRNSVLVCLRFSKQLAIEGYFSLQVIYGCLEVFGCNIYPDGIFHHVYNSSSHTISYLMAQSSDFAEPFSAKKIIVRLKEIYGHENEFPLNKKQLKQDSVIFIMRKLNDKMCNFVSTCLSKSIFLKAKPLGCPSKKNSILNKIGCNYNNKINTLIVSHEYKEIVTELCNQVENKPQQQIFVVCGIKNAGKSSFIRYFINNLLQRTRSIQYLDCDVGQSEFTPPGCISLLTISKPLLGPNFTHLKKPDRMCFYGDIAPLDSQHYLKCLQFVCEKLKKKKFFGPIIVNTMGYSNFTNFLLANTVFLIQPTYVIELARATDFKMPDLTSTYVHFLASKCEQQFSGVDIVPLNYRLLVLSSPTTKELVKYTFAPYLRRNLTMLSYISQIQPENFSYHLPINMLPLISISWKTVALYICHSPVKQEDILRVFNASWIALCQVNPQEVVYYPEMPYLPKFLKTNPVCECFGFGIVRNIDTENNLFLILTPLEETVLGRVNCFLKGNISLPENILTQQLKYMPAELPYVNEKKCVSSLAACPPVARRYKRKYLF